MLFPRAGPVHAGACVQVRQVNMVPLADEDPLAGDNAVGEHVLVISSKWISVIPGMEIK